MQNKLLLCESSIKSQLNDNIDKIVLFQTIDSTNTYCKNKIDTLCDRSIVVSLEQTSGRGRLGKSFYSPANHGIYYSLFIRNPLFFNIDKLTTLVALAVTRTIEQTTNLSPQIKWVNDIFIDNKKVAGILCESAYNVDFSAINHVIIGIGTNITPCELPTNIANIAASLNAPDLDINNFIATLTNNTMLVLNEKDIDVLMNEYKKKSLLMNKIINFTANDIAQSGYVVDITKNGELVIATDNGAITLSSGEVTLGSENISNI